MNLSLEKNMGGRFIMQQQGKSFLLSVEELFFIALLFS